MKCERKPSPILIEVDESEAQLIMLLLRDVYTDDKQLKSKMMDMYDRLSYIDVEPLRGGSIGIYCNKPMIVFTGCM